MIPKLINTFKSEKGSGLVLSLMVLLVLSVLGFALGFITVGSHRLADINRDSTSAYYIAEAGANMAYEEIESYVLDAYDDSTSPIDFFNKMKTPLYKPESEENSLATKKYSNFESQSGSRPEATVFVTEESRDTSGEKPTAEYTIKSVGNVDGKTRTVDKMVTVNWFDSSSEGNLPEVPINATVIVKDSIKYLGGSITGDVYLDSKEKESFSIVNQGKTIPNKIYSSYPDLNNFRNIFKGIGDNAEAFIKAYENNTVPSNYNFKWTKYDNYIEKLKSSSENYHLENTNYTNNGSWKIFNLENKKIKTTSILFQGQIRLNIGNSDSIIVTNDLTQSWGNTQIIGDGSLTIVVLNSVNFNGPLNTNNGNLRIVFPHDNQSIVIPNGATVTAQFIAPYSEVTLVNNSIKGNIIAKSMHVTNDGGQLTPYNFKFSNTQNINKTDNSTQLITSDSAIER